MLDMLDMCWAVKTHQVSFILNPDGGWTSFPEHLRPIIEKPWTEIKYFSGNNGELNPEILNVPNDCGGIYVFLIKPVVIPEIHLYLAYIGRAKHTQYQNLRKRVSEYAKETKRPKICMLKKQWGDHLYLRYLPLDNNELIDEMEKELIKAILPPFNDQYPEVYNKAIRAAF